MRSKLNRPSLRLITSAIMVIAIIISSFFLQLPWSPNLAEIYPDSGVFMYSAQEILGGKLLYRDIWDHKPPAIFYINALAMAIAGENPWAIWWLGYSWITITTLVFLFLMSKLTNRLSAFFGSLLFLLTLLHPDYYQGGNFTEVYALLPQILIICSLAAYISSENNRHVFLIGFLTALVFLLKQTYISTGLAAIITILWFNLRKDSRRQVLRHIMYFIGGGLIALGIVVIYWGINGALKDLWDATVMYNLFYTRAGLSTESIYGTLRNLIITQPIATVFTITVVGFIVFVTKNWSWLAENLSTKKSPMGTYADPSPNQNNLQKWTLLSIFLAIPMEIFFLIVSGRNYGHYYMTPLPVLAIACTYLFSQVLEALRHQQASRVWPMASTTFLILLLAPWLYQVLKKEVPTRDHLASLKMPLYGSYRLNELHEFVMEHSEPSESVLVWHVHPSINFLTRRHTPSKYIYPLPLFYATSGEVSRFNEFLSDIRRDPPVLILAQEVSSAGIPFFGAAEDALCPFCNEDAKKGMQELKLYVEQHYMHVETIGDWVIYERTP